MMPAAAGCPRRLKERRHGGGGASERLRDGISGSHVLRGSMLTCCAQERAQFVVKRSNMTAFQAKERLVVDVPVRQQMRRDYS